LASRTTLCDASPTDDQSSSGMWSMEPSSNEIRYRGVALFLLYSGLATKSIIASARKSSALRRTGASQSGGRHEADCLIRAS
jgi:hypothetical protein